MKRAFAILPLFFLVFSVPSPTKADSIKINYVHMLGSDVEYPFLIKFTVEFDSPAKVDAYWQTGTTQGRDGIEAHKLDDFGYNWLVTLDMRFVRQHMRDYAEPAGFCVGHDRSGFKRFSIRKRAWSSAAERKKYPEATPLEIVSLDDDDDEQLVKYTKIKPLIPLK